MRTIIAGVCSRSPSVSNIAKMSYGKHRRQELLNFIICHGELGVNKEHQLQTKFDPDLKWLLKKKKVKMVRYPSGGKKCKQTFLVLL